ncbi:MAG: hypothetical protein IPL21_02115 [Saprospirales bacterium]|nr:hypothetical protein [Saprospirales bacterium]
MNFYRQELQVTIFSQSKHIKSPFSDSTKIYIAKYDLQGNLIKRKKLPYGLCNYANYYLNNYSPVSEMHLYFGANSILPYPNIKIYDNENNTFTGYFPYYTKTFGFYLTLH